MGDHYGGHAKDYARYRPTYPETLFEQILAHSSARDIAWDCGTGNGQVAGRLVQDFDRVVATDISQRQLDHAQPHERVVYRCCPAQQSGLTPNSVDLVCVATAVHWFDQNSFYKEVERVLKPGGVLAVWTYGRGINGPPSIARLIAHLSDHIVGEDWPTGIEWVDRRYEDLPFPFPSVNLAPIEFRLLWSLQDILGWIDTWSAVSRYRKRKGENPLVGLEEQLSEVWPKPDGASVPIYFPLYQRLGIKE